MYCGYFRIFYKYFVKVFKRERNLSKKYIYIYIIMLNKLLKVIEYLVSRIEIGI